MLPILFISALATLLSSVHTGNPTQGPKGAGTLPDSHFTVGPRFVHMPQGFFLLVRKGTQVGAIRFEKIDQTNAITGASTYQTVFQRHGSGSFNGPNVISRGGEIRILPLKGFSHSTMHQPGPNRVYVGPWWFGCLSPSLVNMSKHFSEKDSGYEFAPTSAQNPKDLDASDPRLHWFRYNSETRIDIPVSELPK